MVILPGYAQNILKGNHSYLVFKIKSCVSDGSEQSQLFTTLRLLEEAFEAKGCIVM
jgi:hypothetical protein